VEENIFTARCYGRRLSRTLNGRHYLEGALLVLFRGKCWEVRTLEAWRRDPNFHFASFYTKLAPCNISWFEVW